MMYIDQKRASQARYRVASTDEARAAIKAEFRAAIKHIRRAKSAAYYISVAIKRKYEGGLAVKSLGCSIDEAIAHIESKFLDGMSWENWGFRGWHIDHIRPLCSFDLDDPTQLAAACHYTNLQPLWAFDNRSKGGRTAHRL